MRVLKVTGSNMYVIIPFTFITKFISRGLAQWNVIESSQILIKVVFTPGNNYNAVCYSFKGACSDPQPHVIHNFFSNIIIMVPEVESYLELDYLKFMCVVAYANM